MAQMISKETKGRFDYKVIITVECFVPKSNRLLLYINLIQSTHIRKYSERSNHFWLNRFHEIWVPDHENTLSGELSQPRSAQAHE